MCSVKRYMTYLFQLYVTMSVLRNCYEISRDHELNFERNFCSWVQESIIYFDGPYSKLGLTTKYETVVNNDNLIRKYSESRRVWKAIIDDLYRFVYCGSYSNITTYPINLRKHFNKAPNYVSCDNASNLVVSYINNSRSGYNSAIRTLNYNQNINNSTELFKGPEANNANFILIKPKPLDNSFYDLYLNTAGNVSLLGRNKFPLKKDVFLQDNNVCEPFGLCNKNLTEVSQEMEKQISGMADVLYKQDVDLGYNLFPIQLPCTSSTLSNRDEDAEKVEAIQSLKDSKLSDISYLQDVDLGYILSSPSSNNGTISNAMTTLNEKPNEIIQCEALKSDEIPVKELANTNDGWAGIPFKIDNETGEYIRLPLDDLFLDILPLAENSSNTLGSSKFDKFSKSNSGERNSAALLDDSTNEISLLMQSFWPSIQNQKSDANVSYDSDSRERICSITDSEIKSAHLSVPGRMDSRIQDIANLFTPVQGLYNMNPDITSYTHYPPKNNSNVLSYAPRQYSLQSSHREDTCFQTQFTHNLDSSGPLGLNHCYPNSEVHCIKSFTSTSADIVQTEGFLGSFLNDECIQMMDISGNERPAACSQDANLPVDSSSSLATQADDKPLDTNNALSVNNITERLDLSCDSAVSSLGSERVASTSDGEWGEGSDSGQDYHQGNYYGPYDYSSSSRNITTRLMPVAQKKYHMFGKRYFQEQAPENSSIHSTIHFLHSTNSVSECDSIENIIGNSAFDECTEEMLPLSHLKNTSKLTPSNVKLERDKIVNIGERPQVNHQNQVRHNHTYSLLHNSTSNSRLGRDNTEYKDILPDGHLTRDEKRARSLNVPIPVADIINLPMDEFNERISKYDLTENQLSLIRDIRRRGKNKVAAQNCRKRKLDQILSLEGEVKEVRRRKDKLHSDRAFIAAEKKRIANKFADLHQHIFQFLRDAEGNPCSPSKYSLQQASDGSIYLLPRDSSKLDRNCHMSFLIGMNEMTSSGSYRQRRTQQSYIRNNSNDPPTTTSTQARTNFENKDN